MKGYYDEHYSNVPPERSHSDGIGLPERKYSRKVTARSQSIPTAHPDNHPSPPTSPLTRVFFVAPRAARAAGSLACCVFARAGFKLT